MFYSKRTVLTNLAIAIALYLAWLLFNALTGCARVPVAVTSPGVGGQPAQVAYMTTLGGRVWIEPGENGLPSKVTTDHASSFRDGAKVAGKGIDWLGINGVADKTFGWLGKRSDTLAKADMARAQADSNLAQQVEANRHVEAVANAQHDFQLQGGN